MTIQQQQSPPVRIDEDYIEQLSRSLNEPSWLKNFRLDAFRQYSLLPEERSNLYSKYALDLKVDLGTLGRKMALAPKQNSETGIQEIAEGLEGIGGAYYVGTSTETIASKSVKGLEGQGVVFCDLREALERHEPVLRQIFKNKAIHLDEDKYGSLNSALFSSAWLLYLPKNVQVQDPLRLRFYLDTERPLFSQTWVYAEENSSVSLLSENYGAEISGTVSEVVEADVHDGSSVHYSNLENYSRATTVLSNKKAVCGKDAQIFWTVAYFGGGLVRARQNSIFRKDGAGAEDVEIVFGDREQRFDLVSDLTHEARHTRGRILANSVLKDKSRSIFKGMIRIGNEAKNANAYLAGHAILLSPDAMSDAIPGLEILTNEVKATHSASVAQIDQDQIFYMMTRGLSLEEAKKFIVLGFLEPGISRINSEELRDNIRDLVESKWYGGSGMTNRKKHEVLFEEEQKDGKQPQRDIFEGHYKYR
jgi:FeS assembly protein SufD